RRVRIDAGETVGIRELPIVDEAVVAGRALEVYAHKNLRNVLCRLHRRRLRSVHHTAPGEAFAEPFRTRAGRRIDQLRDEAVVRQVVEQRSVEPVADLLAPAIDIAGALVVVPQRVVPKTEPVLRIPSPIVQQPLNETRTLVGPTVRDERLEPLG